MINKKYIGFIVLLLISGALLDRLWLKLVSHGTDNMTMEKNPLYWVAPMDANFKRDQPGKSPMGMDLIPVYENEDESKNPAGTVTISASVENNLGVRVEHVVQGDLKMQINTVGYIAFDEKGLTHFHSRVEGWIEELAITAVGDKVTKGQKLFALYSPELVTAQEEYLAAIASGSTILRKAANSKLQALGVNSKQIQNLKQTKKVRQHLDFYAEKDGYVASLNVREGMFIKPATTIASVGSLDTVWVIAEVFERQAAWVSAGQRVDIAVSSYPGERWQGTVDYLYPVLNPHTRTLKARVKFPNSDHRLKPNMFAQLNLNSTTKKNTLSVPQAAIIRDGTMTRVVKSLGHGRYIAAAVVTGIETEEYVEIIDGLYAGDKVVTSAQFLLDSESNISAGLQRINYNTESKNNHVMSRAWTKGFIKSLTVDNRIVSIEHAAIPKWQWPEMTMDFVLAGNIDISLLSHGQQIQFCLERQKSNHHIITYIEMTEVDTSLQPMHHLHNNHADKEIPHD